MGEGGGPLARGTACAETECEQPGAVGRLRALCYGWNMAIYSRVREEEAGEADGAKLFKVLRGEGARTPS